MRLVNHLDEPIAIAPDNTMCLNTQLYVTSEELRLYEDKFFAMFDLNPCPMTIAELETGRIVDANQSFLDVVGLKHKSEILGKTTIELNIISNKNKIKLLQNLKINGYLKNYCCEFKTISGKKKMGMFSGSLIDICQKKYLMLICQVVNKKFVSGIFKTFITL